MQPQTSTALCINTPLVLNAGPESAKLHRPSARCPQSTGSQHQAGSDRRLSHCARRSCLSHYGGTCSLWLLETRLWSRCLPLPICRAIRACTCLDVQPATVSPPAGTFSDAAGSQEEAPKSPRSLQSHPLPPSPLLLLETGVMGTAQSASPVGSQFPSLQHSDHSAPLGTGFLLQSDNDDIPSSPRRETREMSHVLGNGDG